MLNFLSKPNHIQRDNRTGGAENLFDLILVQFREIYVLTYYSIIHMNST
mgnify:CR=1 FL=1